jgi:hypothetical protein
MSQQNETGFVTLQASAATAKYLRVALSSGKFAAAAINDVGVGHLQDAAFADLDKRSVRLHGAPGTHKVVAAAAITANAIVYAAAGGKYNDVANESPYGIALEAADGDGSVFEVLPLAAGAFGQLAPTVEAHTADDTLVASEMYGSIHTNEGAAGTITLTLPPATVGMHFKVVVEEAQEIRVDPSGVETIALPIDGTQGAAGKWLMANAPSERCDFLCAVAGTWSTLATPAIWTAEA